MSQKQKKIENPNPHVWQSIDPEKLKQRIQAIATQLEVVLCQQEKPSESHKQG